MVSNFVFVGYLPSKSLIGYYEQFPPKSMNVSVKQLGSEEIKDGQTRTHVLVANKSFKAGEVIYRVCFTA